MPSGSGATEGNGGGGGKGRGGKGGRGRGGSSGWWRQTGRVAPGYFFEAVCVEAACAIGAAELPLAVVLAPRFFFAVLGLAARGVACCLVATDSTACFWGRILRCGLHAELLHVRDGNALSLCVSASWAAVHVLLHGRFAVGI